MNLDQLSMAWKRAKHFGIEYDGPFSCLHSPIGANYALLIDSQKAETVNDYVDELRLYHSWAEGLNRSANTCKVMDDLALREAFASFRSRLWFDPVMWQRG